MCFLLASFFRRLDSAVWCDAVDVIMMLDDGEPALTGGGRRILIPKILIAASCGVDGLMVEGSVEIRSSEMVRRFGGIFDLRIIVE